MQLLALVVAPSPSQVTVVLNDWISLTKLSTCRAVFRLGRGRKMTHDDAACFCLAVALDGPADRGKGVARDARREIASRGRCIAQTDYGLLASSGGYTGSSVVI